MKDLIKELQSKYEVHISTIKDLIDSTDGSLEPHEMSKYRAVHRFLVGMKWDLERIEELL